MDCLVAGTLITTEEGLKPIENIKIGERVFTRQGFFPVLDTIRKIAETVSITFSNGSILRGTPNHFAFVKGRGIVNLNTLRYGDIVETASSPSINMQGQELAQDNVVRCLDVQPSGKILVYDLNVNTAHEYYANSILVHNSERYILSDFRPDTQIGQEIYTIRATGKLS